MPHPDALYQWTARVHTLFPALTPAHATALAWYSFGLILARSCGLSAVVAHLAGLLGRSTHTLRQRLRELYQPGAVQRGAARTTFDVTVCFGPLVCWAAANAPNRRLVLALDPTCLTDRFRVLCAAVVYRGCALPVAWVVQTADQTGSWNAIWGDLLGRLHAALGDGWAVLVLTDRGLESPALFRAITALGWHPLMRVKAGGRFQPDGWHRSYRLGQFAAAVGRRWAATGVAYPRGGRLACTLLAVWEPGHAEPWLVLTDLPAAAANPAWYAWRMWIERGFKVLKSGGWQWHQTRMTDADRAGRLWAVLAVATIWAVEVGGEGAPADVPPLPGPSRPWRGWGLFQRGRVRLLVALLLGQVLPGGTLGETDWPPRGWQPDPLTEEQMNQC